MDNNKLCFIISHRYSRNYKSYIKYYVDNIQKFYKDSFVLIVDNNSPDLHIIEKQLENYKNMKIIVNNSPSKYEPGAYQEGIRYINQNNLLEEYDYFIFSQDTFILKNKFDVQKELIDKNILACSFNHWKLNNKHNVTEMLHIINNDNILSSEIFKKINIYNKISNYSICWSNSFILHKSKILDYYDIFKDKIITKKSQSGTYERIMGGILYYLNNNKYISLCGNGLYKGRNPIVGDLDYDCHNVDVINDKSSFFFVKTCQQKGLYGRLN